MFRPTLGLLCKLGIENHWEPAVTIMVDYFLEPFCTQEVLKLRKNYFKYQTVF